MTLGEAGRILLNDTLTKGIQKYRYSEISTLIKEQESIEAELIKMKAAAETGVVTTQLSINYLVLKNFYERNKRILRSYIYYRLCRIGLFYLKNINFSSVKEIKFQFAKFSEKEIEYAQKFEYAIENIRKRFPILIFNQSEPPLQFLITFCALKDCGIIVDGEDLIEIKKTHIYTLKKSIVRHLIASKSIKILPNTFSPHKM